MSDETFDPKDFKKPTKLTAQADPEHSFNPETLKKRIYEVAQREEDMLTAPLGPVKTWSFSRLMNFENCPYSVYLKSVENAPDPSGIAAARGTLVHDHIESYIRAEHDDLTHVTVEKGMKPVNLCPFVPMITNLREQWEAGKVEVEGNWGFKRDWEVTDFFGEDVWGRMKLDAIEFQDRTSALAIDWKTGQKFGNELKHNQQGMTYTIGAFMRYPKLQFIETRFVYLDQKDAPLSNSYTRERAMLLMSMINKRANRMTTAVNFPPKPSMHACRWCPHAKTQEGYDEPLCAFRYQEL
jgi:hypothetical protein